MISVKNILKLYTLVSGFWSKGSGSICEDSSYIPVLRDSSDSTHSVEDTLG